jgi:hypothetical protein
MKPIRYSDHARLQMVLRGATEEEVAMSIRTGKWGAAKMGKFQSRHQFDFNRVSLTNQKYYKYKTVESTLTLHKKGGKCAYKPLQLRIILLFMGNIRWHLMWPLDFS